MFKNRKSGFTLIELLVVIAIIGILASIVLASLNSARNKGKDASATASMSSIRSQAEIFYNSGTNSYGSTGGGTVTSSGTPSGLAGACAETNTQNLLKAAASQAGNTAYCSVGSGVVGNTTLGESYEAHITLNGGGVFCVDSNGFAGSTTAPTTGAAGTQAKCK